MAHIDTLIGQTVSHYRILEKIGAGGMGEVYRARDEHLERDVALKFLRAGVLMSDSARRRFRKEALALSKLNHPNIAIVYDFDTREGLDFLVMEHVGGETLSEKAHGGSLGEKDVVRLGLQLAEGLVAAHDQGVIHRDLKPSNTRLTTDGRLKILDFGLAKLLKSPDETTETVDIGCMDETGGLAGTLPYMAPEQLRGDAADARTDIWSAGALLYKIATGCQAFPETQAKEVIFSILSKTPASPRDLNQHLSLGLENVILKCLEKDPENRYQSAKELAVDLRRLGAPTTTVMPVQKRQRRTRNLILVVGAPLVAICATLFALNVGGWRDQLLGRTGTFHISAIAVLPLENLSGDPGQEYFSDGMTEELIADLSQISALKVISRTSVMHYKGSRKTIPEIARELQVDGIVEGSVMRDGNHLRVTAQLIYAPTDTHVWAQSYQRDLRDALAVQDELAHAITSEVNVRLTGQQQVRLARTHPADFAAQEAYFKGRYHLEKGTHDQIQEAKAYFEAAVGIDSNYALAYAGLAEYYLLADEISPRMAMPKAKEYAQKALALDDGLAEAHSELASIKFYGDWDWTGAEKEFKRAIELSPSYVAAHRTYSDFLSQMGRHDQALAEIRTAQELDPLSATTTLDAGWAFYYARKYDWAIEQCRKVLDLDPRSASARDCVGSTHLATAAYEEAIADYSTLFSFSGNDPTRLVSLGCAYALAGRKLKAQQVVAQLNAESEIHYVSPYFLASIYVALGDKDTAFSWLEKAYEQHDLYLVRLKVDPMMDPLRLDPRFERLLHLMDL